MKFNNIFVVDDDLIHHFIIKKLLKNNNIDVSSSFFENGYDALIGLKAKLDNGESTPDLILLDINMPVLDGWQFLDEFRELKTRITKNISIFIISSSDNSIDLNRANDFKDEVKNYYLKPMTGVALKSIFSI